MMPYDPIVQNDMYHKWDIKSDYLHDWDKSPFCRISDN